MSTVRDILTDGYDILNATSEGRPAMTAREASKGLRALQALYFDLIEKGCDLQTVVIDAAYTAGENQRIVNNTDDDLTITLPLTYSTRLNNPRFSDVIDDAVDNTVRPPTDFAVVVIAGSPTITHVYDANLGDWTVIEALTLDSEAPWSAFLGQAMAAMVAKLLVRFGGDLPQDAAELGSAGYLRILARLQMSGPDEGSVFFTPDRMRM